MSEDDHEAGTLSPLPGSGYFALAEQNPCDGCAAPCCRMLLIPLPQPSQFMDLDYMRYMLGFPSFELALFRDGQWNAIVNDTCKFLDRETSRCTVHGTSSKPKTCSFFNPHKCWYKSNFVTQERLDLVRMDLTSFEAVLELVEFDADGGIREIPDWETVVVTVHESVTGRRDRSEAGWREALPAHGDRGKLGTAP